jgi:hypothetical protein
VCCVPLTIGVADGAGPSATLARWPREAETERARRVAAMSLGVLAGVDLALVIPLLLRLSSG